MTKPIKSVASLAALMALATGLLAALDDATSDRVDANLMAKKQRTMRELTGLTGPFPDADVLRCGHDLVVVRASARGYGGAMHLLIRFSLDGGVAGVRVPTHQETPGFADILDPDDWLGSFSTMPFAEIDAVSGATVTSRAVLDAIVANGPRAESLAGSCAP